MTAIVLERISLVAEEEAEVTLAYDGETHVFRFKRDTVSGRPDVDGIRLIAAPEFDLFVFDKGWLIRPVYGVVSGFLDAQALGPPKT